MNEKQITKLLCFNNINMQNAKLLYNEIIKKEDFEQVLYQTIG